MELRDAIAAIKSNYPTKNYTMLREALDLAIWALEKQIPKEPFMGNKVCGLDDAVYSMPSCPGCKEVTYFQEWCPFCGQRLALEPNEV